MTAVMILCWDCNHWNKWTPTSNEKGYSYFLDKIHRKCENCGSGKFDWHSICSIETWDPKRKRKRGKNRE